MKKHYLLLGISLFLLPLWLGAQRLEKFSDNEGEFIAQLGNYMTSSKQKTLEDTYKEFEKVYKGGMFTADEMRFILQTGNAMLAQRMSASPYFSAYLNALVALKQTPNATQYYSSWHEVVVGMLTNMEARKVKPFQDFLEFSTDFFKYGALRYSNAGTSWYPVAEKYEWKYEQQMPVLQFEKLDLLASRKKDSILIKATSGAYYPVDQLWKGKGGTVSWERLGLSPDVYAKLGAYEIDAKKSIYETADAQMHYPQFLGNKIIGGSFSDKLSTDEVTEGSYPRFESNQRVLEIRDLGQGISYVGGFRLQGTTVYGYGSKEEKARISIKDQRDREVFHGKAELFTIRRGERIVGERVEATLINGKDSIYHPSVNLRFEIPSKEIQLSRGQRGSDRNPFFSSMHQVNIDTENIQAYVDKDSVVIGKPTISISRKGEVIFESLEFFNQNDYQRIQNIATANPIAIMKATAEREGSNFIDAELLAQRINSKFTVENIQSLLYDLVSQGFINYDSDKKIVEVKPKVFHYVNADQSKVDYDNLRVYSNTDDANAVFDFKNNTIKARGVNQIEFSRTQKVGLLPAKDEITLKKNRYLDFDGKLFAGYSTFMGTNFHFEYDKFHIRMDSIRFFDLFVPTGQLDKNQQPIALAIASRIEHLAGTLLIDAPSNKSGREDIAMFPSFQSKGKSYVFYDKQDIQGGAYTRDSFYFEIDPFSFNSLDQFTPKDVQFKGALVSAKVFPKFRETLLLQEDQSLGFMSKTPAAGFPAYGGKGNYTGNINLSNKGLLGQGNIKYLGAAINSEDIIFKPQQTLASAERFNLEEDRVNKVQVPQTRGINVKIDWRPYRDSMYIRSAEAPFAMFKEGKHSLEGALILTPGGLKADGVLDWDAATLRSHLFSFGAYSVKADTMDVNIKSPEGDQSALITSLANGALDFDKKEGLFKANEEVLKTQMPAIKYITSTAEFKWDMNAQHITFKADPAKPGTFVSTDPEQDSLKFQGQTAFYDITPSVLKVGGVPHIVAADAFIYPHKGDVEIEKGGLMKKLENAEIIADTLNKYHVIKEATVNILGRRSYKASGKYEYNVGDREQRIVFQNIDGQPIGKGSYKEKRVATRAQGTVTEKDKFYIDHKTQFQGTIKLSAESKNLSFDGYARLDADKLPDPYWFKINSEGDKRNLVISYDIPKDLTGAPIYTGLYLSKENSEIYPRVMMPLRFRKDRQIFPVKGVFMYNKEKDSFIFGDSARVVQNYPRGNYFVFKNYDATVEASGRFNLCSVLKYIKIDAAGIAQTKFLPPPPPVDTNMMMAEDTLLMMPTMEERAPAPPVTAELMTGIQLIVPDALMKVMINDLTSSSFDAKVITYLTDIDFYKKAAFNIFPDVKEVNEAIDGITSGYLDIPQKYNPYTFVFSRLKLKWKPNLHSFINTDENIGLVSVNGESINKVFTGYVEFKMPTGAMPAYQEVSREEPEAEQAETADTPEGEGEPEGDDPAQEKETKKSKEDKEEEELSKDDDRLYVYIKAPSTYYYFFAFKQGILGVNSNNPAFVEALKGLKEKDLVFKMPDGKTYEIKEAETTNVDQTVNRIKGAMKE